MDDLYSHIPEGINTDWNLHEDFSVTDAAALAAGYEPTTIDLCKNDTSFQNEYPRYKVIFDALTKAIAKGSLKATLRYSAREYGYLDHLEEIDRAEIGLPHGPGCTAREGEELTPDHRYFYKPNPDWKLSTVERATLTEWLVGRGVKTGFLFPTQTTDPDYLNPGNARYAPKLAAAVHAWLAVTKANGKHPKQAIAQWVQEHAAEFGLTDDNGKPNATAVDEIAKVANWQPTGGAPKTPGS